MENNVLTEPLININSERKSKSGKLKFIALILLVILLSLGGYAYYRNFYQSNNSVTKTLNPLSNTNVTPTTKIAIEPTSKTLDESQVKTTSSPNENNTVIQVFFFDIDKFNMPDNTDYVTGVSRSTNRIDIATFALEQILNGPTPNEMTNNLSPTFGTNSFVRFTGESNCSGKDFQISIEDGQATVRFCRTSASNGDSAGFIVEQQINNTLKQFPTVKTVKVLNPDGFCFNDMRAGENSDDCIIL